MPNQLQPPAESTMKHHIETPTHNLWRVTQAWQDALEATLGACGEQLRRLTQLGFALFSPRLLDRVQVPQSQEQLAERTAEVLSAQAAVAGAWLRSPWWLVGVGSAADLPTSFVRLLEANSQLAEAAVDAVLAWQRALTTPAETARAAVDAQTSTAAQRLVEDAGEARWATFDASRHEIDAAGVAAGPVVAEARMVAEAVGARAEQEQTAAFQRSHTPGGGTIKGKLNHKSERIYHLPGQMNYDRLKADTWFETEEQARGSGFRRAKR